jgi:hypothetical protein
VHVGGDVDLPRELPDLRARGDGIRSDADPGVRAEEVHGAERLPRAGDESRRLGVRGHVAAHGHPGGAEPRRDPLGPLGVEVGHHDPCALGSEALGHRAADARRAARDDRDLPAQLHAPTVSTEEPP